MKKTITALALMFSTTSVYAQTIGQAVDDDKEVTVVEPVKKVPEIKSAAIDDESFELGAYVGFISLEDFDTVSIVGASGNYHLNDRWLLALAYGKSSAPEASFEDVVGGDFVKDRDSGFQYLSLLGAYEFLEGRSFWGQGRKLSTHLYADFGLENVNFAGESDIGLVFGATYKLVLNDWLTADLRMRDHVVSRSFLGEEKTTQNLELVFGLSALF
ncbi:outer membrane beta-barrel domain-containing protein [Agaribacterium haliotis]|uniref:outer membrane beta-barrel domain-containing protein n=1 Tax=Agaribacterium haliotis TaxID=2013869 RepID=UPI000BB5581D|nr:outer membrane beta-barrel domain-containing protein [Agaribacterium haliotis]